TAQNIAFNANCLAAPANTAFTLQFTNNDGGTPHNVEIFTNASAATRLGGATGPTDILFGPGSVTYQVDALPAGSYFFRCDVHALILEYTLIKSHRPRFNVRYRDDKSYPYLALTVGETWPRARVMRGPKRKGVRYFGPFGHAYAIRETLDALTRVFPVRTCS